MVTTTIFLPNKEGFSYLGDIHGGVRLLQPSNLIGGATELLLVTENDFSVRLFVDYTDVVFKFECFSLMVDVSPAVTWLNAEEVAILSKWNAVKCLFRFEWERPALPGEVPEHWEQVVRHRGKRPGALDQITAICVSMVGVVFLNSAQDSTITSILIDDSDPATLRLCRIRDEIETFMAECECVELEKVQPWVLQLPSSLR